MPLPKPPSPRTIAGPALAMVAALTLASARGALASGPVRAAARPNPIASLPREKLLARIDSDSSRAFRLYQAGEPDSARRALRPLASAAPSIADSSIRARVMLLDATLRYFLDESREALDLIERAERIAAARADTFALVRALNLEGGARGSLGEQAKLAPLARRMLELAEAARIERYVGHAHYRLGYLAIGRGDWETARREMQLALQVYDSLGMSSNAVNARTQQGNIAFQTARYDEARQTYERLLRDAVANGDRVSEGLMLNNLAAVESRVGDLERTRSLLMRSRALQDRSGQIQDELLSIRNLFSVLIALGRVDESRRLAEEGLALAKSHSLAVEVAHLHVSLGDALVRSGQENAAKALWRSVLAGDRSGGVDPAVEAARSLSLELADEDSVAAAIGTLRSAIAIAGGIGKPNLDGMNVDLAGLLVRAGRYEEALARAGPLADSLEAGGDLETALSAQTHAIQAERRLGRTNANVRFDHAVDLWERQRRQTSSYEIRDFRDDNARALMMDGIALALAGPGTGSRTERVRAAFDRVQRFKIRTLLERMLGPRARVGDAAALPSRWPGTARFQRERLAPGDLLVEFASDRDTTYAFAITRDSCAVFGLPSSETLAPILALGRDVIAGAPRGAGGEAAAAEVAKSEGALLLGPLRGFLSRSRRVMFAPDGPLVRVPFAALVPPGGREPLAMTHDLTVLPAAMLLETLRAGGAASRSGRGMLAVAGAPSPNQAPLAGAMREVQELARRFLDVQVWSVSERTPAPSAIEGFRALHIAGHSVADDQFPWRSGFVVGPAAGGGDSLLTAGDIAGRHFQERLVVLSSCESAGRRDHLGEGLAGLGTAFVAAGVPTVVATLWPVDDRVTADLMSAFYDEIARNRPASEALRRAQLRLRARSATRHPHYWAGFVVIGDGDERLALQKRPGWGPRLW